MSAEMMEDFELQDLLDAMPYFAMVLDDEYNVVMANCAYTTGTGCSAGRDGVRCYEGLHGLRSPIAECPLAESLITGQREERDVHDERNGWLHVSVYPFARRASDGTRLYLHIARPKV